VLAPSLQKCHPPTYHSPDDRSQSRLRAANCHLDRPAQPSGDGPPALVRDNDEIAESPDLHGEARFVEPGDVEDLVVQEAAISSEGHDYVPAVTRAEGTPALEEDVVPWVPEPVGERSMPPPR